MLGEQRGAAITDINADGRPDLAVTVNSGPLLLWTNQSPIPGLSARVRGPASNPTAIGAVLRVIRDTTPGPAHEIRAGSGRYSQDSATVFLGPAPGAQQVEVRFAGQPARAFPVPTGATHLVVDLRTP